MFGIKEKYKKKVKRQIEKYCNINYRVLPKSSLTLGEGLFNHRCQWNAVQQVKNGNFDEVYLCVCMNDDTFPVVHFINKKGDKYTDNTLGFKYEEYDYFVIRKVDESEYLKTNDILCDTKKMLLDMYSNKFLNKLLSINEHNLGI